MKLVLKFYDPLAGCASYEWNVTPQIYIFVLCLLVITPYGQISFCYRPSYITAPACQPEAIGQGMAINLGSARREIAKFIPPIECSLSSFELF